MDDGSDSPIHLIAALQMKKKKKIAHIHNQMVTVILMIKAIWWQTGRVKIKSEAHQMWKRLHKALIEYNPLTVSWVITIAWVTDDWNHDQSMVGPSRFTLKSL